MENKVAVTYNNIISVENLCEAWREFLRGKKNKKDVAEFAISLSHNIYSLHYDLLSKSYTHGPYEAFKINDPKPRDIHKASVRDRLLHHAIYRVLYPYFDKKFVYDSYSCRINKGTHRAMNRFRGFSYKVSKNHTKTAWALKCDIRKFFASIDQATLSEILKKYISDQDILWLLGRVIVSFYSTEVGKGLPLGNLTSQLLVNIYMNELDQFVKHKLKVKYYIRYADDFVIMDSDKTWLENILLPKIELFLKERLALSLHHDKVSIKTLVSGVDFLGWAHFPSHRVLRTTTKRRIFKAMRNNSKPETAASYISMLGYGNTHKLSKQII